MKSEKEIEKLVEKYSKIEEQLYNDFLLQQARFEKEQNPLVQIKIFTDEMMPTIVKTLVIMDKLNLLLWMKVPQIKESDLDNSEKLKAYYQQLRILSGLAINCVDNSWKNFNDTLQAMKKIMENQLDIIEQQSKLIERMQRK